ncbi:TPA: hypothetical protein ACKQDZ_002652 [Serratia rubidaea]
MLTSARDCDRYNSKQQSGNVGGQFLGNVANNLLVGANNEGHASSTTKSAVSDGAIVIRDQGKQQQDVNELSRDVEHANGVRPISAPN